jgi:signal transduction histidine kinase
MANETLNDAGIRVSCQIDAIDHLLERDQSLHLYRIVQEAIRNIICHADADQVLIRLTASGKKKIELQIADNGRGIHAA